MELEEALGLKVGTTVIAGFSSANPALTGGKQYTLRGDARPVYHSELFGVPRRPGEAPCNCDLSIEDDRGNIDLVGYSRFRLGK